ncbi:MAG: hypothetical protein ACR2QA_15280 [Solirubrobacteraceae bacterium]
MLTALFLALAGCGGGRGAGVPPSAASLPLVDGATVVAQNRQCDSGANAFCALELVVVDPRYRSSTDLVSGERQHLRAAGWPGVNADTGLQRAAESPGRKLRVTYATAEGDLQGIEQNWIKRPQSIQLALSRALIARDSVISLMVESGSS